MIGRPGKTGAVAWGVCLSFRCPEVIALCGQLGFEWLFLDAERTPLNLRLCRELVRAADAAGMPCMVRVPKIEASVIEGYLQAGVLGIMAPKVSSAAEARSLVRAVESGPADAFTVALIESREGIAQCEAILDVPGLHYVAVGPNDLGLSLGLSGGIANPQVCAIVDAARARIKAYGKPQVAVVSDAAQAQEAVAAGAMLVGVPDKALLAGAGRSFLDDVRHTGKAPAEAREKQ